ncbi:protein crossbronx homolog [Phlebotomus argentipes]|uniref:protein crossbronx homolog n=1 Tax=Phlebotomus argentipes TaxID=94469 RepID=UPI0028932B29|nr:protein crossbronx homolog [Phlebotomus argentipes]
MGSYSLKLTFFRATSGSECSKVHRSVNVSENCCVFSSTKMTLDAKIQQEYKILAEYKMLMSENLRGVYVIPSHDNPLHWFGVIFVREGLYREGIFRFSITFPDTFPNSSRAPVIEFKSEVFHPFIRPETRQLDTRDAFPDWDSSCHLWQLLKYVIYVLEQPEVCLSSSLIEQEAQEDAMGGRNREALEMLKHNRADFVASVKKCVQESQERVYENVDGEDKHAIVFEAWDQNVHQGILEKIKSNQPLETILQTQTATNTGIFP